MPVSPSATLYLPSSSRRFDPVHRFLHGTGATLEDVASLHMPKPSVFELQMIAKAETRQRGLRK